MSTTRTHRAGSHKAPRKPLTGRRRSLVVAAATATVVIAGSTAAFAYWTTTGTGSGAASSRTMTAPTFKDATASGTSLYPGLSADAATSGTLVLKASNPNPFPITVTITSLGTWTDTATCTDPALTLTTTVNNRKFTLAANASDSDVTLSNVLGMASTASDNCQGKTLKVPFNTSSQSN